MQIRNRIVGLVYLDASEIDPSDKNWREHPEEQRQALRAVFAEIGFAGVLLVRKKRNGRWALIDGHLRREEMEGQKIPCLHLDVTAEEADKLLAVFDPIAAMATANTEKLKELVEDLKFKQEGMTSLVEQLTAGVNAAFDELTPDFQPVGFDEQGQLDEKQKAVCPKCGHEF